MPAPAIPDPDAKPKQAPGVRLVDEAELRERIQARWDAAIAGNFAAAYELESPAFRETMTLDEYTRRLARAQVRWHVATLKELRYDQPRNVDAVITLDYSFAIPGTDQVARTQGDISEQWTYKDGQWWRHEDVMKRPLGASPGPPEPKARR
jgi:hypothetical protein